MTLSSYLAHIMQPKPADVQPPLGPDSREKEHQSRLSHVSGALSTSILSIGDLFKDTVGGQKTVKFPEKLVKVLEQRLQNIAMGKDAACVSIVELSDFLV